MTALLAACGGNAAPTTTAPTTASAPTAAAAEAPTTASAPTAAAAEAPTAAAATDATAAPTAAAADAPTAAAAPAATKPPAPTITPVPAIAQPEGSAKITFWYGLTGANGNIVRTMVNTYNSSQSKYYVEAIQQPDYDATITKFNTSLAGGDLPNVVQVYDIGTQRMIDTKRILPIQDFIDQEKLPLVADLEEAVARYYTIGGKLYSMPFNSSAPVMYFDKNAFKEVGLDANKTAWTYDEVLEAATKLTKKDASGKITRSGLDFSMYGWFLEQEIAIQGAISADPANGRSGRATKLTFNNDAGQNWLNFLKKLQDAGVARNVGRHSGTTAGTTLGANFAKGEAAMTFESIATLRNFDDQAKKAGGKV
ncbi:MAG: hypothetical protein ABIV47_16045, partial [Roseiflexaceae bacterium]